MYHVLRCNRMEQRKEIVQIFTQRSFHVQVDWAHVDVQVHVSATDGLVCLEDISIQRVRTKFFSSLLLVFQLIHALNCLQTFSGCIIHDATNLFLAKCLTLLVNLRKSLPPIFIRDRESIYISLFTAHLICDFDILRSRVFQTRPKQRCLHILWSQSTFIF